MTSRPVVAAQSLHIAKFMNFRCKFRGKDYKKKKEKNHTSDFLNLCSMRVISKTAENRTRFENHYWHMFVVSILHMI